MLVVKYNGGRGVMLMTHRVRKKCIGTSYFQKTSLFLSLYVVEATNT